MAGRGDKGKKGNKGEKEIYLEFQRIGNAVKVVAMDPESMVEVSIVGPSNASDEQLSRVAIKKLEYVLNKRKTRR